MTGEAIPLKWLAGLTAGQSPPSTQVQPYEGEGLPFLQGNAEFGRLVPSPVHRCDTAPKVAEPGDILVSVRAPVGALNWAGTRCGIGRGLAAVRPGPALDDRFCWWWLSASMTGLRAVATGSTYEAVTVEDVGSLRVPHWSRSAQRAIADYLDAETARMDTLIAQKQSLITILGERRRRILDQAAGVGEAGNWPDTALKRLGAVFTDGDWIESPFITSNGIRLIQTGNIGRGVFRNHGDRYITPETFAALKCTEVMPGDVLISRLANTVGQACRAPELGVRMVTSVDVVILRPRALVDPEYLVRYLSSELHLARARLEARGTTMQRLARSQVGELRVPLPTLEEQRRIVHRIDSELGPIDAAVSRLEDQIDLLQEHRQALITAAVTGELDIAGVAA